MQNLTRHTLAVFATAILMSACGGDGGGGPTDPNNPDPIPEFPSIPPGTLIFQDDIDSENGGTGMSNYTGWSKWNVVTGCVDLHGPGSTNPLPGNGVYLDLDGSCMAAGTVESKTAYTLDAGNYILEFIMAGNNQTPQTDQVTITVGSALSTTVTLDWQEAFEVRQYPFNMAAGGDVRVRLAHAGGDDQGILIDAIRLRKN